VIVLAAQQHAQAVLAVAAAGRRGRAGHQVAVVVEDSVAAGRIGGQVVDRGVHHEQRDLDPGAAGGAGQAAGPRPVAGAGDHDRQGGHVSPARR
jgi:hypothetical protein